jgi:serine/threonine-protein kinase
MPLETVAWLGQTLSGDRYQVTAKLGHGGMGFVYRARDRHLDCDVVIKVPRAAMLEDPEFAGRFSREIRSLVRLVHPHIVKVFDFGQHEGFPFAVLQYLSGGSLRDRTRTDPNGKPLPLDPAELHDWLEDIAGALDFIHGQSYIHRDVKPDNILFDAHGHVYLSDFGVAKALSKNEGSGVRGPEPARTALTGTGIVLGTPQYMAPELVMGGAYDGRVDQYGLGVMLYELLGGRYPFDGPTAMAVFVKQSTEAAPSLKALVPSIPKQVASAIQRAMGKDPDERYPSCTAFAQDVLQAIAATRRTEGDRDAKVPVPNAPRGVSTLEAVPGKQYCPGCGQAFTVLPTAGGKPMRCPRCRQVIQPEEGPPAILADWRTVGPETRSPHQTQPLREASRVAGGKAEEKARALSSRQVLILLSFAAAVFLGLAIAGTARLLQSRARTVQPPLAGKEGETIKAEPEAQAQPPSFALQALPESLPVAAGTTEIIWVRVQRNAYRGPIEVNAASLPLKVACAHATIPAEQDVVELRVAAAAEAGQTVGRMQLVVTGETTRLEHWINITTYQRASAKKESRGDKGSAPPALASPETAAKPSATPRSKENEQKVGALAFYPKKSQCVAFSPDGRLAVSGGSRGIVELWEVATGKTLQQCVGHPQTVRCVAFSPDGKLIASGSDDGTLRLWTAADGRAEKVIERLGPIYSVVFSADGMRILAGGLRTEAYVLDVTTGSLLRRFPGHPRAVNGVAFSPDGRWALTGSGQFLDKDNALRLWELSTDKEARLFEGHTSPVTCVAFSPDSRSALSASSDETIRLWDIPSGKALRRLRGHKGKVFSAAFSPDGRRVLSGGLDRTVRLWDIATGSAIETFTRHQGAVHAVAISPHGRRALSASETDGVRLWRLPK